MNKDKIIKIIKNTLSVIVVLALFIIIYYQNRDRNFFQFGESNSKPIQSNQNSIDGYSNAIINKSDGSVAVLTSSGFSLHDSEGDLEVFDVALSTPALHTKGEFSVCYDLNAFDIFVLKGAKESYRIKTDNKIISAKVNRNGYLFVSTEKDGYNCECLIYNRSGDAIFKWDVSKSEFLDGDINDDNNTMILSLTSAGDNKLVGEIIQINITNAKVIKQHSFDSMVFFAINFNTNDTYVALGSNCLKYFNTDGTEKWTYDYNGKKLMKADVSNHDNMALAFSGSGEMYDGNFTDVIVVNRLGQTLGKKTYKGSADDISVGNSYISIAIDKEIIVASSDLEQKKKLITDYSVKNIVLFNDDSSVFVLGSSNGEILK